MILLRLLFLIFSLLRLHIDYTVRKNILTDINRKIIRSIRLNNTLNPVRLDKRNTDLPARDPRRPRCKINLLRPDLPLRKFLLQNLSQTLRITDLSILHSPLRCRNTKTIINLSLFTTYLDFRNSDLRCLDFYA